MYRGGLQVHVLHSISVVKLVVKLIQSAKQNLDLYLLSLAKTSLLRRQRRYICAYS